MGGKDVFAKTIWAEARGEPEEGQKWVGHVIKNRAAANRGYWGGSSIEGVCRKDSQFECWNGKSDIDVSSDRTSYNDIRSWSDRMYDDHSGTDPTGGALYYNNPDKEGYPDWTTRVRKGRKIGNHQFYYE